MMEQGRCSGEIAGADCCRRTCEASVHLWVHMWVHLWGRRRGPASERGWESMSASVSACRLARQWAPASALVLDLRWAQASASVSARQWTSASVPVSDLALAPGLDPKSLGSVSEPRSGSTSGSASARASTAEASS